MPLYGVGPTVIDQHATPMVAPFLATPDGRKQMREHMPLPMHPGKCGPDEVAKLLYLLVSADNSLWAPTSSTLGAPGAPAATSPLETLSTFADN